MHKQNLERGFVPLIVIAIVAILAIGGGVYYVKHKDTYKTEVQTQTNVDTNTNTQAGAYIGSNARGNLRALLAIGQDVMCTFSTTNTGSESSGTMYISADGKMRGDYKTKSGTSAQVESHMIVSGQTAYVWSLNQGTKMNMSSMTNASAQAQAKSSVDLDSEVDYKCSNWTKDSSKFSVPSTVTFVDIEAMMKGSIPAGVKVNGVTY